MATATELAQEAMEQVGGDVIAAAKILERKARADTDVWIAVTQTLIATACYDACRAVCRSERRQIWVQENYSKSGNGERVKSHGHKTMLDWPLPGGMKLRDAKKADLVQASGFYQKQARSMESIARWLDAIAAQVGRKAVGSVFTDEELRALKNGAGPSKEAA